MSFFVQRNQHQAPCPHCMQPKSLGHLGSLTTGPSSSVPTTSTVSSPSMVPLPLSSSPNLTMIPLARHRWVVCIYYSLHPLWACDWSHRFKLADPIYTPLNAACDVVTLTTRSPCEDIHLENPLLLEVTFSESMHSQASTPPSLPCMYSSLISCVPPAFNYIRSKISWDPSYLGECQLNHYWVCNVGFADVGLLLPKQSITRHLEGFYAVSVGWSIGIFLIWWVIKYFSCISHVDWHGHHRSEASTYVTGCPNNAHQKLPTYANAIVWLQVALLWGTLEVVPSWSYHPIVTLRWSCLCKQSFFIMCYEVPFTAYSLVFCSDVGITLNKPQVMTQSHNLFESKLNLWRSLLSEWVIIDSQN